MIGEINRYLGDPEAADGSPMAVAIRVQACHEESVPKGTLELFLIPHNLAAVGVHGTKITQDRLDRRWGRDGPCQSFTLKPYLDGVDLPAPDVIVPLPIVV